ncbi:MAG: hypothetical protein J1F37_05160 [Oscillospiraceae bacterium]|nr:hypothetical protein [Oscillospiraceae bacterium]
MSMFKNTKKELTAEEKEQLEKKKAEWQKLIAIYLNSEIRSKNTAIDNATWNINYTKEMRKILFSQYGIKAMTKHFREVNKYNIDILYNRYILKSSTKALKKLNNGDISELEECEPLQKRIKEIDKSLQ